jgi:hypothetical protein
VPEKRTPYKPDADTIARYPHLIEFFGFMHDLRFESHRGLVLLCCAYLDDLLRDQGVAWPSNGRHRRPSRPGGFRFVQHCQVSSARAFC